MKPLEEQDFQNSRRKTVSRTGSEGASMGDRKSSFDKNHEPKDVSINKRANNNKNESEDESYEDEDEDDDDDDDEIIENEGDEAQDVCEYEDDEEDEESEENSSDLSESEIDLSKIMGLKKEERKKGGCIEASDLVLEARQRGEYVTDESSESEFSWEDQDEMLVS